MPNIYIYVWEIDNFVIKSDILGDFSIVKIFLMKLSCYHDWISKRRVSACMSFLVMYYIYISYFDISIHANDQIHVWKHYLQVFYVSGKMLEYILRFMPERAKKRQLFLLHLILYFSMSIRFSPSHHSLWWWRIAHEHMWEAKIFCNCVPELRTRAVGSSYLESLKCHFLDFGEDLTEFWWSENSVLVCRNLQFGSIKWAKAY
jgi:hypothetical protein